MKLTAFFLLLGLLHVHAHGVSQTISFSGKLVKLEKLFEVIEQKTGFTVFYDKASVAQTTPVSITVKDMPLQEFLSLCLRNQPLDFSILNTTIVISPKKAAPAAVPRLPGFFIVEPPFVKGNVYNEKGEPIQGVTVTSKRTGKATATDSKGAFRLKDIGEGDVLVFTGVNVAITEVTVGPANRDMSIQLKTVPSALDEVQIIAYGTTTRRFNTGNVTTIKSEDIQRQPVNNILQALQGRVPGMQISAVNSSMPGNAPRVEIRGTNSIGAGTAPLYILDGVPIPGSQQAGGGGYFALNALMMLNPADVESIDILKDAEATAIYGSRGANGVVLITTKKGKSGKPRVSLNAYTGFGKVGRKIDLMNLDQYIAMRTEALKNTNTTPNASNAADLLVWDRSKVHDWQDELIGHSAVASDLNLSVSGGRGGTRYLVNTGYHKDGLVFPGDAQVDRKSVRFSLDHSDGSGKFSLAANPGYSENGMNVAANDLTSSITLAPHYPAYLADGSPNWNAPNGFPLSMLLQPYINKTTTYNTNLNLRYSPVDGLNLKVNAGINNSQSAQVSKTPIAAQNPSQNPTGSANFNNSAVRTWIVEPQADYTLHLGMHSLTALAGGTWQHTTTESFGAYASGYTNDALLGNIGSASIINPFNSGTKYAYVSFFSRLSYNYLQQYLLNVSFRRDGSSRFGPGKRFGNFGAVSGGWLFTQNKKISKALSFLSYGKLRASYGINGNDQIGDYGYLTTYGPGFVYQNPTLTPQNLENADYRWEENRKVEAGLELGFLKDRIFVSASFFRNRTGNQLINYILPPQTGWGNYQANFPALLQNQGWEFELVSKNIATKDLTWRTSVNFSLIKNKLLDFPGIEQSSYTGQFFIGQPLSVRQAYKYTGLSNTGVPVLEDINKDNSVNSFDRYIIGSNNPLFGGIQNDISFKGFQVGFLLEYTRINNFDNTIGTARVGVMGGNALTLVLDRWQKPGDEAFTNRPKFTTSAAAYNARNFSQADIWWTTTHVIRLRNASASYDLPQAWLKKLHLQETRLYVLGQNLWVFDKNKYRLDPETGNSGLPPLRTITFGINCTF